jgi:hypothetical protein
MISLKPKPELVETYVHVGFGRFAQVATYADRMQPVQSSLENCGCQFEVSCSLPETATQPSQPTFDPPATT